MIGEGKRLLISIRKMRAQPIQATDQAIRAIAGTITDVIEGAVPARAPLLSPAWNLKEGVMNETGFQKNRRYAHL